MTQFELSEFLDAPFAPFYCGFKASDIGQCLYKICNDNVRPKQFLGADDEDGIEVILSECKRHFLHEIIDGNDLLCPFIDLDLPKDILDAITSKLLDTQAKNLLCCDFRDVCLEIFPE